MSRRSSSLFTAAGIVMFAALLSQVVMPALGEAEDAFAAALARINVEDLTHSAAALRKSAGEG